MLRKAMFRDQANGICVLLSMSCEDSIEWVERVYQYAYVSWVS